MNILLTGASGFVGRRLAPRIGHAGHRIRFLCRQYSDRFPREDTLLYDLSKPNNNFDNAFADIDVVIHLAAKVHDLSRQKNTDDYATINTNGTRQLIDSAVKHKVKRFIFLSSIKVYGDCALRDVTENTPVNAEDLYAESKLQSEELLKQACKSHGIEYVIIRPPLVFGPEVKANFYNLIKLVDTGLPLPMASIRNKRSLIYVDNLCEFIIQCVNDYKAKDKTFVIKDFDVSTPQLIKAISISLEKSNRLFPMPIWLIKGLGCITGKQQQVSRLVESLTVDHSEAIKSMNWQPLFSFEQCMNKTVNWYLADKSK